MADSATTDRRSFLKTGALAAAPFAVAVPALAADGSRARLARLEAERAIETLHCAFLRQVNGQGDCAAFVARADAILLEDGLRSIADDPAEDGTLELAADGRTAASRRPVLVELDSAFAGHSTLERMARFQGHGSHRRREARMMATDYIKGPHGWRIARLVLA
ncbi:MAG: hypothetical protein ABIP41_00055 [Croceibacterium sp.]